MVEPATALDILDAGAGLMPVFTTPMDVIAAGAGYGNPVKDSRILKNGKEHRVALLWFNGHKPTITGFHQPDRKLKYMFVEQRIYKGPNRP